jgi:hypothetical protein
MNDAGKTLRAVRNLAAKDLQELSDQELRDEISADGQDPDVLAFLVAQSLDEVVASFLRSSAAASRRTMKACAAGEPKARPPIERIKQLIEGAFSREPQLAAVYREGSKQTDRDLQSLYDDLLLMGKIEQGRDGS